jgi:hypothetical protein
VFIFKPSFNGEKMKRQRRLNTVNTKQEGSRTHAERPQQEAIPCSWVSEADARETLNANPK